MSPITLEDHHLLGPQEAELRCLHYKASGAGGVVVSQQEQKDKEHGKLTWTVRVSRRGPSVRRLVRSSTHTLCPADSDARGLGLPVAGSHGSPVPGGTTAGTATQWPPGAARVPQLAVLQARPWASAPPSCPRPKAACGRTPRSACRGSQATSRSSPPAEINSEPKAQGGEPAGTSCEVGALVLLADSALNWRCL